MSKKKPTRNREPDKFQYFDVNPTPVDEQDVKEALRDCIRRFVQKNKQDRARLTLLNPKKRDNGIRKLWTWLESSTGEELGGSAGFPQNLQKRFGELLGIYVDAEQCVRVSIA